MSDDEEEEARALRQFISASERWVEAMRRTRSSLVVLSMEFRELAESYDPDALNKASPAKEITECAVARWQAKSSRPTSQ